MSAGCPARFEAEGRSMTATKTGSLSHGKIDKALFLIDAIVLSTET